MPMSEANRQKPSTYAIRAAGISRAPQANARCRFFPALRWTRRPVPNWIRTIILQPPDFESTRKNRKSGGNVLGTGPDLSARRCSGAGV